MRDGADGTGHRPGDRADPGEVEALRKQLADAEHELERLVIAGQVIAQLTAGDAPAVEPAVAGPAQRGFGLLVPPRGQASGPGDLPGDYRSCAMRRIVVLPAQRAEIGGNISGSDALPEFERTHGRIAWQKTGGRAQMSGTARREIRVILVKA